MGARLSTFNLDGHAHPDVLDQKIIWRLADPRYMTRQDMKGKHMQRQWTIEARADFDDPDKNEVITKAIQQAARHVHATLALLADSQQPQVVAFSDDFFSGHQEISLLEDVIGKGLAVSTEVEAPISSELLEAARELQHDKNNSGT